VTWLYYCESCKQLRGFDYSFKPNQCGGCGSRRIDIDRGAAGIARLQKRRFGDGPAKGRHAMTIDPQPDGTRIVHNIGSSSFKVKRFIDESYETVAPGEALGLEDIIVEGPDYTMPEPHDR
jgi:hypothetical protein